MLFNMNLILGEGIHYNELVNIAYSNYKQFRCIGPHNPIQDMSRWSKIESPADDILFTLHELPVYKQQDLIFDNVVLCIPTIVTDSGYIFAHDIGQYIQNYILRWALLLAQASETGLLVDNCKIHILIDDTHKNTKDIIQRIVFGSAQGIVSLAMAYKPCTIRVLYSTKISNLKEWYESLI